MSSLGTINGTGAGEKWSWNPNENFRNLSMSPGSFAVAQCVVLEEGEGNTSTLSSRVYEQGWILLEKCKKIE
jgi:hypothetical protein